MPIHAAEMAVSPLSATRVYPNPWRIDKHSATSIKFDNITPGSTIKIFTVSAREIKTLSVDSAGSATWDRTNDRGDVVASGVYIYLIIDLQGNETSGKLAIIK